MLTQERVAAAMKAAYIEIENDTPEAEYATAKRTWRLISQKLCDQLAESMEPVPEGSAIDAYNDSLEEFARDCRI